MTSIVHNKLSSKQLFIAETEGLKSFFTALAESLRQSHNAYGWAERSGQGKGARSSHPTSSQEYY